MLKIQDAADFLIKCKTKEYRRECLRFWRGLHGNDYADKVQDSVLKRWKKK